MFYCHVYLSDTLSLPKRCLVMAGNETDHFLDSLLGPCSVYRPWNPHGSENASEMKENSKLVLLDIGKGHRNYMYKS